MRLPGNRNKDILILSLKYNEYFEFISNFFNYFEITVYHVAKAIFSMLFLSILLNFFFSCKPFFVLLLLKTLNNKKIRKVPFLVFLFRAKNTRNLWFIIVNGRFSVEEIVTEEIMLNLCYTACWVRKKVRKKVGKKILEK